MKKMPGKMIRWYGMAPTFSSGEKIHLSISSTLKYSFSMPVGNHNTFVCTRKPWYTTEVDSAPGKGPVPHFPLPCCLSP